MTRVGRARASDHALIAKRHDGDPYVTAGLVTRWRVRAWTTVIGDGAAAP